MRQWGSIHDAADVSTRTRGPGRPGAAAHTGNRTSCERRDSRDFVVPAPSLTKGHRPSMEITPLLWGITIAVIVGLLAFDYLFHVRKAHLPTIREAAIWSAIYVGIALLF